MSKEPVELLVTVLRETSEAILIDDGLLKVWIPKSQLLEELEDDYMDGIITITIPEWLAEEKELI